MAFNILLENLKTQVLTACTQPLFEIAKTRSPEYVSSMTGIMGSTTTYHYPSIFTKISTNLEPTDTEHCNNSYVEVSSDLNTTYFQYTTSDDLSSYCSSQRTTSCGDTEGFCFKFLN